MIGQVLGDRYELLEKVGEGGMARVYKAKCHLLNRYVAVKILKDEFADDEEFVKKFRRESQAAASLSHPNILNIYDVGVDVVNGKNTHYIVMEYIEGKTLKDYIKAKGPLGIDETIDMSIQIAEALKDAHNNHIIHRDIKPQNIMITDDARMKVTDFGIARAATSATVTATSSALGSVHYLSPEQARGGYTDAKSDIYSLGIVMFEMVTGRLPYNGDTPISIALKHIQEDSVDPRKYREDLPADLAKLIMKCTEKNQNDRYEKIEDVIVDLKKISLGEKIVFEDNSEDEFATKVLPRIDDKTYSERASDSMMKKEKSNKRKKSGNNLRITIVAIISAFLLVSVVFFGFLKIKNVLKPKEEITVPSFVGKNIDLASSEAKKLGLELKVKSYGKDDKYKENDVIKQSIEEGSTVKEGFIVDVVVNKFDEDGNVDIEEHNYADVEVPNVIGKSLLDAEEELRARTLIAQIEYKESDTVPENLVIDQIPAGTTVLKENSIVTLYISEGTKIEQVDMPNVKNLSLDDAKATLKNIGLNVRIVEESSTEFEKGKIMWQSLDRKSVV